MLVGSKNQPEQDHVRVADCKYGMGLFYAMHNEMDLACELFLECQQKHSKELGPGHSMTVITVNATQLVNQCAKENVSERPVRHTSSLGKNESIYNTNVAFIATLMKLTVCVVYICVCVC